MKRHAPSQTIKPEVAGRHMDALPEMQTADSANDELIFNALLYPNRSLSAAGFYVVMGIVIAVNIVAAFYYFVLGAWPIIFFAGLDIAIVWLAFHLSYRQGRRHERLIMTRETFWVCRVLPSGHETRWRLQPYWTKAVLRRPEAHDSELQLISHGRRLVIGAFLAPGERAELAQALEEALHRAQSAADIQD